VEINQIIHGDCLEVMSTFPDKSFDMVLCDLPYQLTSCPWDLMIPLEPLWEQYKRIVKDNAAIVLTSSQPFTSILVMSNLEMFRHEWIWIKNRGSNFANTVREPMKEHESALVFSNGNWTYNQQMQERTGTGIERVQYRFNYRSKSLNYRDFEGRENQERPDLRVPSSWQRFNVEVGLHPNQKPVALGQYLIRTYTNEGDLVLDNACGSGSFLVAAMLEGRNFVGIEKEAGHVEIANARIAKERLKRSQLSLGL
jgi:site-specific DNA-methyltransferase (adenine-specific)